MSAVGIAIFGYVALQLAVGYWASRKIVSEDDYLLAGRSLGMLMSTFTVFATWFGAETCIGAAGQSFEEGVSGNVADPFAYGVALILVGAFLAARLYHRKLVTLADLFRQRFSVGSERLVVLLMVPTSVLWAAAQIRAFGQIVDATSGLNITLSITVAAAIVMVYTTGGGMLADAYTDLIQGTVLILGLLLIAVMLLVSGDGQALSQVSASKLRWVPETASALSVVESWAIPLCGSLVAQELIARVLSARSPRIASSAPIVAGGVYLMIGAIPVFAGLIATVTMPDLADPEHVLLASAERLLPGLLYVVFAGALVSAILSTVDSALLVSGSLVAHNLVLPLMHEPSPQQKVRINRIGVFFFGLCAYVLALQSNGVYALVEEASAFGTSGLLVCVLFGLFSKKGGHFAATLSLVVGVVVYVAGSHAIEFPYPYLSSLVLATLAFAVGAFVDARRPSRAKDEP